MVNTLHVWIAITKFHPSLIFSLTVNFVDEMVEQFKDEDDFIISVDFDNQKGNVDLYVHY